MGIKLGRILSKMGRTAILSPVSVGYVLKDLACFLILSARQNMGTLANIRQYQSTWYPIYDYNIPG